MPSSAASPPAIVLVDGPSGALPSSALSSPLWSSTPGSRAGQPHQLYTSSDGEFEPFPSKFQYTFGRLLSSGEGARGLDQEPRRVERSGWQAGDDGTLIISTSLADATGQGDEMGYTGDSWWAENHGAAERSSDGAINPSGHNAMGSLTTVVPTGRQPLSVFLEGPPGSWLRPRQRDAGSADASEDAPQEGGEHLIRLVKAARPPPPLKHNKSQAVTSLTVNAIPLHMRRPQLCALLDDTGFAARYNYAYVPCNCDKTNRGHAFVNFCSPEDAKEFFSAWHGARVAGFGGHSPVISVSVSMTQGFESSVRRWTARKILSCVDADFQPYIAGISSW